MDDPRVNDAFRALSQGNKYEALSIIEGCIDSAKDDNSKSYYSGILARINEILLRYSDAIDVYENAILIDSTPFSLLNYAEFLVRQNRKCEAQDCLERARKLIALLKKKKEKEPAAHWASQKFKQIITMIE